MLARKACFSRKEMRKEKKKQLRGSLRLEKVDFSLINALCFALPTIKIMNYFTYNDK